MGYQIFVAGVKFENNDGSSRQSYIKKYCDLQTQVYLIPEPTNTYDCNAIGIYVEKGLDGSTVQIGYVPKETTHSIHSLLAKSDPDCTVYSYIHYISDFNNVEVIVEYEIPPVKAKPGDNDFTPKIATLRSLIHLTQTHANNGGFFGSMFARNPNIAALKLSCANVRLKHLLMLEQFEKAKPPKKQKRPRFPCPVCAADILMDSKTCRHCKAVITELDRFTAQSGTKQSVRPEAIVEPSDGSPGEYPELAKRPAMNILCVEKKGFLGRLKDMFR